MSSSDTRLATTMDCIPAENFVGALLQSWGFWRFGLLFVLVYIDLLVGTQRMCVKTNSKSYHEQQCYELLCAAAMLQS